MANGFMYPYARFLNASPDMGTASFFVNDEKILSDSPYGEISGYKQIPAGNVTFRAVWNNGGDNIIYTLNANISNGEAITLALAGEQDNRTLIRINDTGMKNDYKVANMRIVNLVSDFDGFDVYANGFPILDEIEYLDVSNYIFLRPDTYEFAIKPEGTDDIILSTGNQVLKSGMYYTLFLIGNAQNEGMPVKTIFAVDAMSYDGQYL